jgi:hypothetical protein
MVPDRRDTALRVPPQRECYPIAAEWIGFLDLDIELNEAPLVPGAPRTIHDGRLIDVLNLCRAHPRHVVAP